MRGLNQRWQGLEQLFVSVGGNAWAVSQAEEGGREGRSRPQPVTLLSPALLGPPRAAASSRVKGCCHMAGPQRPLAGGSSCWNGAVRGGEGRVWAELPGKGSQCCERGVWWGRPGTHPQCAKDSQLPLETLHFSNTKHAHVTDRPHRMCMFSRHVSTDPELPGMEQRDPVRLAQLHTGNSDTQTPAGRRVCVEHRWQDARKPTHSHSCTHPHTCTRAYTHTHTHSGTETHTHTLRYRDTHTGYLHTLVYRHPQVHRYTQSLPIAHMSSQATSEAVQAALFPTPAQPSHPQIPCPVLGKSWAHMTQREGCWDGPRRNCIIFSNHRLLPQGIKAQ
jgi:hypothetical protein